MRQLCLTRCSLFQQPSTGFEVSDRQITKYDGTASSIPTSISFICASGDSSYQVRIGAKSPACRHDRCCHGCRLSILPLCSNFLKLEARRGWQGGGFSCCLPRSCGQALPLKPKHGAMYAFVLSFIASYLELPIVCD